MRSSDHSESERTIIFLSAHLPSGRSRQAGQRLAFEHLRFLAKRNRVVLASFALPFELQDADSRVSDFCEEVHVIPLRTPDRLLSVLRHPLLPLKVAFRQQRVMRTVLASLQQRFPAALWWIEYEAMAQYVSEIPQRAARSVVICHDVESQTLQRRSDGKSANAIVRRLLGAEARRTRAWERRALPAIGRLVAFSDKDRDLLTVLGAKRPEVAFPHLGTSSPNPRAIACSEVPTVLFYGAMGRHENEDGVLWFVSQIWPIIRRQVQARLVIVGSSPSDRIRALDDGLLGVSVTGFVDDPTPYFAESWLAIAPLRLGAGVKIKVVEYLRAGLPVVSTDVGAEGIPCSPDAGLIVTNEAMAFGSACLRLLGSRESSRNLGNLARSWYEKSYRPFEINPSFVETLLGQLERNEPVSASTSMSDSFRSVDVARVG
jgi:glycosyltransferase involved in cell wall biosynthesis